MKTGDMHDSIFILGQPSGSPKHALQEYNIPTGTSGDPEQALTVSTNDEIEGMHAVDSRVILLTLNPSGTFGDPKQTLPVVGYDKEECIQAVRVELPYKQ